MSSVLDAPARLAPPPGGLADRGGRLRELVKRHPVTAFLCLTFALGYPVMALPILVDHGVIGGFGSMPHLPGVDTERVASVLLVFVALLPATLLVTWAADGATGLRDLARRVTDWRIGPGWWVLVMAGLPVLTLAFAVILGDSFTPVDVAPFLAAQAAGLLVNLLLINVVEETAWAGFVQTRVERRNGWVTAALFTAVPFALIHLPLHFIGEFSIGSVTAALVTLLIVCALVRLLIGTVLRGTGGSILAVALLHTAFNRSNNDEGIVAGLLDGDGRKLAGLLAVLTLTIALSVVTRRNEKDPS